MNASKHRRGRDSSGKPTAAKACVGREDLERIARKPPKKKTNFEYQYAIADHQGNTRVLFSGAPPAAQSATANFEAATNANFQNYVNRSGFALFNRTAGGTTSQLLNGGVNGQIGLAKTYRIYAGDKVKIEAYGKYTNATTTASNLAGFATALLNAYSLPAPTGGETGTPSAALNTWGGLVAGGSGGSGTVKAFVNIIVFDKNYKLLDMMWDPIDASANQVGATPVVPHDYMVREYTAKEECIVYLYVSNESPTLVDVYFDDVAMTYTPSRVVQYNEYYPFQSTTQNSWTRVNTVKNSFLGNGGTEMNATSNFYDLEYRHYDPILGRMNGVDPMADKYSSLSPYNFSFNDPVTFNDVNGAEPLCEACYMAEIGLDGISAMNQRPMDPGGGGTYGGYGYAGGGWTANIGGLIINYNSLKDGVHSFNFRNGQLINYTGYDFQTVSSKYGTTYRLTDQYGNNNSDLVFSIGYGQIAEARPTILIRVYDEPKGWDANEFSTSLSKRLVSDGFSKDLNVTYSELDYFKSLLFGKPTATVAIKKGYLGKDVYDAGGYSVLNSEYSVVYKGLILGTEKQVNRLMPMHNYINAAIHELGHALFGFPDYNTRDGGPTKGIMDYKEAYNGPLIQFTHEQSLIIKASKWGRN